MDERSRETIGFGRLEVWGEPLKRDATRTSPNLGGELAVENIGDLRGSFAR